MNLKEVKLKLNEKGELSNGRKIEKDAVKFWYIDKEPNMIKNHLILEEHTGFCQLTLVEEKEFEFVDKDIFINSENHLAYMLPSFKLKYEECKNENNELKKELEKLSIQLKTLKEIEIPRIKTLEDFDWERNTINKLMDALIGQLSKRDRDVE